MEETRKRRNTKPRFGNRQLVTAVT